MYKHKDDLIAKGSFYSIILYGYFTFRLSLKRKIVLGVCEKKNLVHNLALLHLFLRLHNIECITTKYNLFVLYNIIRLIRYSFIFNCRLFNNILKM